MRFLLTYTPEQNNSGYVQFLVDVDDYGVIEALSEEVEQHLQSNFPDTLAYTRLFRLGPGDGGRVQAKIMGPDRSMVRRIAEHSLGYNYLLIRFLEITITAKHLAVIQLCLASF